MTALWGEQVSTRTPPHPTVDTVWALQGSLGICRITALANSMHLLESLTRVCTILYGKGAWLQILLESIRAIEGLGPSERLLSSEMAPQDRSERPLSSQVGFRATPSDPCRDQTVSTIGWGGVQVDSLTGGTGVNQNPPHPMVDTAWAVNGSLGVAPTPTWLDRGRSDRLWEPFCFIEVARKGLGPPGTPGSPGTPGCPKRPKSCIRGSPSDPYRAKWLPEPIRATPVEPSGLQAHPERPLSRPNGVNHRVGGGSG